MLKNFKSRIFLFCSSAFRNLQPTTYNLQPSPRSLQPNRGFAMLFSVLISSLLVVIGLSIFNITLKELTISTSGRESQTAFYAANSGMECALYWDLKEKAFATSTTDYTSQQVNAVCNAERVNTSISRGATTVTTASNIPVTDSNGSCFDIIISKTPASQMTTTIESRGKNICGSSGRRVERGLKATIVTNM